MVEVYVAKFTSSLSAPLTVTTRPTTISVSATLAAFGSGTFSIAIYNAGTDANPVNFEALEVTSGGATTTWTVVTETGWTPATHASGSTIIATVLTPRAIQQPIINHTTPSIIADPHTGVYIRQGNFTAPGQLLVGTGSGTYAPLAVGANGSTPIADSTQVAGIRWAASSVTGVLTHMGDLFMGGILGLASRLGIGTVGQLLTVGQNTATIANPSSGPTCSAVGSGGSLSNGTNYDFAFAWQTANAVPDGGITLASPITTFLATTTGVVNVQAPAAPSANLTLVVYGAVTGGALRVQSTLANASTSITNSINISTISVVSAVASAVNSTGGVGPSWITYAPPIMVGSGTAHASGAAPDPGATPGLARFLREDATWSVLTQESASAAILTNGATITTAGATEARVAPAGPVTGIILGAGAYPGQQLAVVNESAAVNTVTFAAAGTSRVADGVSTPITGLTQRVFTWDSINALWSGTAAGGSGATFGNQTSNTIYAGPATGAAALPSFRALIPLDVPVMLASGTAHAAGLVPDPGSSAGVTRFLREDATFAIPPASSGSGTSGGGGSGALIPIAVVGPLSVAQATIAFASIPQTGYRNLRISMVARGTVVAVSANVTAQFNGDAGANYDWRRLETSTVGTGASTAAATDTSAQIGVISGSTAPASVASHLFIDVPHYGQTTFHKTGRGFSNPKTTSVVSGLFSEWHDFYWRNTAAITSITLSLSAGNFDIGSYACLYGEMDGASTILTPQSNLLSETVLSTAQASISIPNISQAYRSLRIEFEGRSDVAATTATAIAQVNGDTATANYVSQQISAQTATPAAAAITGRAGLTIGDIAGATTADTAPSFYTIRIPNYTGTVWRKTSISIGGTFEGTVQTFLSTLTEWHSTAAITSLAILPSAGNFVVGTTVRVYGEPAAAGGASVGTGTRVRNSAPQAATTAVPLVVGWDTEDNDADNQHFTSVAALTGTVAKATGSTTLTGTGTTFLTELSVGQVISVPGTATEVAVVIAITSSTLLTTATAFANTASGQVATRLNSPVVFRQPGFYTLETTIYSAAVATGNITLQYRLNGTLPIDQKDQASINAIAGYELVTQRQFQQWDYIEVLWTQSSGGTVNVLSDERTHWSIGARPTIIVATPYINIQDQKTLGTSGGTFTAGAARTRTLTIIDSDSAGISSLTANQITLPPGTYRYHIVCPALKVDGHQAWLQNITLASVVKRGTSERSSSLDNTPSRSVVVGRSTFQTTTVLEVQHQCITTEAADGFGPAPGFGTEVYTVAEFWKES